MQPVFCNLRETEREPQNNTMIFQSHSPGVPPWWCESCVRRARWSWQTSSSGRTRPVYSQGPRLQVPWWRDPSSLPRYRWLVGQVASVPLERLMENQERSVKNTHAITWFLDKSQEFETELFCLIADNIWTSCHIWHQSFAVIVSIAVLWLKLLITDCVNKKPNTQA